MKENVLDVLMYLFETYVDTEEDPEPDQHELRDELSRAGFGDLVSVSPCEHAAIAHGYEEREDVLHRADLLAGQGPELSSGTLQFIEGQVVQPPCAVRAGGNPAPVGQDLQVCLADAVAGPRHVGQRAVQLVAPVQSAAFSSRVIFWIKSGIFVTM